MHCERHEVPHFLATIEKGTIVLIDDLAIGGPNQDLMSEG